MNEVEEGIRRYSAAFSRSLGACPNPCPVKPDATIADEGDESGRSEERGDS